MKNVMKLPLIGLIGAALMLILPTADAASKKHKKRVHGHGHAYHVSATPGAHHVARRWRPGVSAFNYTSPQARYHRYYASSNPYYGPYYHFYPRFRTYDNTFTMYTTGAHYPRFRWARASYGYVPHGAIMNSYWHGRPAYKCKTMYRRGVRFGRVGTRGCYFDYRGRLMLKKRYAVQVHGQYDIRRAGLPSRWR